MYINLFKQKQWVIFLLIVMTLGGALCTCVIVNIISANILAVQDVIPPRQISQMGQTSKLLWEQSPVERSDQAKHIMAAANEKMYLIEQTGILDKETLVARHGATGNVIWQQKAQSIGSEFYVLAVSDSNLYVGSLGDGDVRAYDLDTGELRWKTKLSARTIANIRTKDDKLYINTATGQYILDQQGEIVASSYMESNLEIDINDFSDIIVLDKFKFTASPTFLKAIDRQTDRMIWSLDTIASNPVVLDNSVFVLTVNNELLRLNLGNGEVLDRLVFDGASLLPGAHNHLNYLAIDQTQAQLYVLLADSQQLFAFEIQSIE